jgi:hypothetical protein
VRFAYHSISRNFVNPELCGSGGGRFDSLEEAIMVAELYSKQLGLKRKTHLEKNGFLFVAEAIVRKTTIHQVAITDTHITRQCWVPTDYPEMFSRRVFPKPKPKFPKPKPRLNPPAR